MKNPFLRDPSALHQRAKNPLRWFTNPWLLIGTAAISATLVGKFSLSGSILIVTWASLFAFSVKLFWITWIAFSKGYAYRTAGIPGIVTEKENPFSFWYSSIANMMLLAAAAIAFLFLTCDAIAKAF